MIVFLYLYFRLFSNKLDSDFTVYLRRMTIPKSSEPWVLCSTYNKETVASDLLNRTIRVIPFPAATISPPMAPPPMAPPPIPPPLLWAILV